MNAPTGKIDPMAVIKNVMLITVATEITESFEKKDSKKLAGIMVRECVQRGESFLSQVPQDTMEEAKEFYEIIARIYSTMALKAGVNPINAIAFKTGFSNQMSVVSDFPIALFDSEEFKKLQTHAQRILVKYTGRATSLSKSVQDILA